LQKLLLQGVGFFVSICKSQSWNSSYTILQQKTEAHMYSDKFLKAFEYLMYHEDGYANDPKDAGGETKYGISKRSYPNLNIKDLTRDQACKIYFCDFWLKAKCEDINDENIATKFFDLAVHTGIPQAVKLIQRALRSVGQSVIEDGIIGVITLQAINKADPTDLLAALKSEAAGFYRLIARTNPSQKRFIDGWLNRAYHSTTI
jgi:lysozyme family protein